MTQLYYLPRSKGVGHFNEVQVEYALIGLEEMTLSSLRDYVQDLYKLADTNDRVPIMKDSLQKILDDLCSESISSKDIQKCLKNLASLEVSLCLSYFSEVKDEVKEIQRKYGFKLNFLGQHEKL